MELWRAVLTTPALCAALRNRAFILGDLVIRHFSKMASLAAAILLSAGGAQAAGILVYSNFAPQKTFGGGDGGGNFVSGPAALSSSPYSVFEAASFSLPTFGIFLDHLDLVLVDDSCNNGSKAQGVAVDLVADKNGQPMYPGPVIEHWLVTKLPSACTATIKPTRLNVPLTTTTELAGGKTYWIVVTPIGLDDAAVWDFSPTGVYNQSLSFDGGGSWNSHYFPVSAFDVWRK